MSSNRHSRNCLPRAFSFLFFLVCFCLVFFNAKDFYIYIFFFPFYLLDKTCCCGVSHFYVLLGGVGWGGGWGGGQNGYVCTETRLLLRSEKGGPKRNGTVGWRLLACRALPQGQTSELTRLLLQPVKFMSY